jgi:hypothetical protein
MSPDLEKYIEEQVEKTLELARQLKQYGLYITVGGQVLPQPDLTPRPFGYRPIDYCPTCGVKKDGGQ